MTKHFSSCLLTLSVVSIGAAGEGCGGDTSSVVTHEARPVVVTDSPLARIRVDELRARFASSPESAAGAVIEADVAIGFERQADGRVRAVIPDLATRGIPRTASVSLPASANAPVELVDDTSRVAARFALRGAGDAAITTAGGIALYRGALGGADVVHRVTAGGTEDYVVFQARPEREELTYDVDVSRVAGLRLVANTIELLDAGGAPALRVAAPYVVDASGARSDAKLAIVGCAFDRNPRSPFGRAVTAPGASTCAVSVGWRAASYPAIVDPSWESTGLMTTPRMNHTLSLLASGEVLVAGGSYISEYGKAVGNVSQATAELFDPTTRTFASTGSMAEARDFHTASLLPSGKVLIAGGETFGYYSYGYYSYELQSSAEIYDPEIGTFSATGSMSKARYSTSATTLPAGTILVAGGATGDKSTNLAEIFDETLGTFTVTGSLHKERQYQTGTLLPSGKVLIAGGSQGCCGSGLTLAELYDPSTGTFSTTGSMATARSLLSAVLLGTGEVLVAGGSTSSLSAELYDPTAGAFSPTGSTVDTLFGASANLLPSGKVLFLGGGTDIQTEVYDPASGAFAVGGALTASCDGQATTALASGTILVTGGQHTAYTVLRVAALDDNLLTNGDFTSGLAGWTPSATLATLAPGTAEGSGEASVLLGQTTAYTGIGTIRRHIDVPAKGVTTLTYWGKYFCKGTRAGGEYAGANIEDGSGTVLEKIASKCDDKKTWESTRVDLSSYAGTTVHVVFFAHDASPPTTDVSYWYLSNVSMTNQ